MEPKSEESSAKEEGELSDDNEDVDSGNLKVIDEWTAESQPETSTYRKTVSKNHSESKDNSARSNSRRVRERERHEYRSSRSYRNDRDIDRYERRHSPTNTYRRPESRFWDRHRATTPRIHNAHSRRSTGRIHGTNKENDSSPRREVREISPKDPSPKGIPCLLDLTTTPPPLPPPPFPEAQTDTPESPPPLPPPLIAPRRRKNRKILSPADKRARARERLQQISQAPICDDPEDINYIDLLLEYKEIREQLDSIKKEEASYLAEINSDAKPLDDKTNVLLTEEEDDLIILEEPTPEIITVEDDEPQTNDPSENVFVESTSQEHTEYAKPEEDEEDLDELHLRFLALASAAKANKRAQLSSGDILPDSIDSTSSGDDNRQTISTKKVSEASSVTKETAPTKAPPRDRRENRKRSRPLPRKDSQDTKKRRFESTRSRERETRRTPFERDRRLSARDRTRKEDKKNRLRRNDPVKWRKEAQKILVLDDHREQAERFLQLIGEQSRPNVLDSLHDQMSKVEPIVSQKVSPAKEVIDNYESVEMDIDSNPGSPNIELEIERLQKFENQAVKRMAPSIVSSDHTNEYPVGQPGLFFGSRDSDIPGLGDLIPGLGGELPTETSGATKVEGDTDGVLSRAVDIPLPPSLPAAPPPPPPLPVGPPQPVPPPPPPADDPAVKRLMDTDTSDTGHKQAHGYIPPETVSAPVSFVSEHEERTVTSHSTNQPVKETPLSQRLMRLADYRMQESAEPNMDTNREKGVSCWDKEMSSPETRWTKNPGVLLFSSRRMKDDTAQFAGSLPLGSQVIPGLDVPKSDSEDDKYDPETPSVSPPPGSHQSLEVAHFAAETDSSEDGEHGEDDIAMTALRAQLILGMKQRQERKIQQLDEITGSPSSDAHELSDTVVPNDVSALSSEEPGDVQSIPQKLSVVDDRDVKSPSLSTETDTVTSKFLVDPSPMPETSHQNSVVTRSLSLVPKPVPKPVPLLTSVLTSSIPSSQDVPGLSRKASTSSLSSLGETVENQRNSGEIPETKRARPLLQLPQHKPVIIPLGNDSDDSDTESPTKGKTAATASSKFLGSLDQFLSNVRHDVEKQETVVSSKQAVTTPEAVKNLSENQRLEYKKLKEMLVQRGDGDKGVNFLRNELLTSPSSSVTSSPKRIVVTKSMEQITMEKRLKLIEVALDKHRSNLVKEERTLENERLLASKKKTVLHAAKSKVQTLKEQLDAAQRIVSVTEKRIETHNQELKNIQDRVNKEKVWVIKFEEERIKTGKKLFGEGFPIAPKNSIPSMSEVVVSPVRPINSIGKQSPGTRQVTAKPGSLMTVTVAAKKSISKISKEKQYWQQLANEYEKKIQLLKQAKASVQFRRETKNRGNTQIHTPTRKKKSPPSRLSGPEKIKTEEKIKFEFGSDVENEIVKFTPRRKSVLDMSPGITTPKLSHPSTSKHRRRSSEESSTASTAKGIERPPADKLTRLKIKLHQMMLQGVKVRNDATSSNFNNESGHSRDKISSLKLTPVDSGRSKLSEPSQPSALPYTSHLLTFKSYRFCPYFRTKSQKSITSPSFSHRINSDTVWCRFDIAGDCQDKSCPWQHMSDVKMSEDQLLGDIISYSTGITGIVPGDNNSAAILRKINSFVKEFRSQNSMLKFEQQCILLANKVSEHAKHKPPHVMFTEKRRHHIKPKKNVQQGLEDLTTDAQMEYSYKSDLKARQLPAPDDVIQETDVRYWMLGTEEAHDMESLLLNDPQNTQLWMKLAYKKLTSRRSSGDSSIDQALNVLSRGLEQNKESSDMWLYFLELYARRGDQESLLELYEQAVSYAPVYQLWWKYQSTLELPVERFDVCQRVKNWLCSLSDLCAKKVSHYLLQIVLLQTKLKLQCSTSSEAFSFLEKILTQDSTNLVERLYDVSDKLTAEDMTVAWMCLVHIKAFKCLPPHLYDPSGDNSDIIVNKDLGVYNWVKPTGTFTQAERQALNNLLQKARAMCTAKEGGRIQHSVQLYINTCPESGTTNSYEGCVEGTNIDRNCIKLWLYVARYVDILGNNEIGVNRMFDKAIELNPSCVELYYTAALNYLIKGNKEVAVSFLEQAAKSFFQLPNKQHNYPSLLFCKLLKQELPLGFEPPKLKEGITSDTLQSEQLHLWLSFCVLFELRGDPKRAIDMYERALSLFSCQDDLRDVWVSYIKFTARQAFAKHDDSLVELVNRCLLTTPCKFPLPYHSTNQHWLDYSLHNMVLELVFSWLPENELLPSLQYYTMEMPSNVSLIVRTCDIARTKDIALAKGLLKVALLDFPRCATLWKM